MPPGVANPEAFVCLRYSIAVHHGANQAEFPDDTIAGWIVVGLAGLYMILVVLTMLGIGILTGLDQSVTVSERNAFKGFLAILTISQILMGTVNIVVGLGITRSARWAFITGLVFNTLISLTNFSLTLAFDDVATLATVMIAVYCFLRLAGHVGPKPT